MWKITYSPNEVQKLAWRHELKAKIISVALSLVDDPQYERKDAVDELIKIAEDI